MPLFGRKKDKKKGGSTAAAEDTGDNVPAAAVGGRTTAATEQDRATSGRAKPARQKRLWRPPATMSQETADKILTREGGTALERFQPNKRPVVYHFEFNVKTFQIMWFAPGQRTKASGILDVAEIREIRDGAAALNTKDFRLSDTTGVKEDMCFVIMHGNEFKLKQLCLQASRREDLQAWTDGIWHYTFVESPELYYKSHMVLERFLEKSWNHLDKMLKQSLGLKEVKMWMQKLNYKIGNRDLKDLFTQVDKYKQTLIGMAEFTDLYHLLADVQDLTREVASRQANPASETITAEEIHQFLQGQGDAVSLNDCRDICMHYGGDERGVPTRNFVEYLHGADNSIWNPERDSIYMDMNQPLAHYFISSSHNTYLLGDQFRSESSVEAYIRCLRDGCRCVEIDCWDGPNNDPIVYHGHTLTSKIKFTEVLPAIRDHAFIASDYPVILSIENHCSLPQQQVMADEFKKVFGDQLVIEPLPDCNELDRDAYPSPEQFKGRVIIKHKKLKGDSNEVDSSHKIEDDLCSSVKNGYLLLEDKIDGSWTKHYFVLTNTKIFYAEAQDEENAEEEDDDLEDTDNAESKENELHYGEAWFHAKLKGGRVAAEQLLKQYRGEEGSFLVRESDTFPGEFSLSFWRNGAAQHCRIRCKNSRYFLTDQVSFVNLYELIEYYRREDLKSASFRMKLTAAVPQPAAHEQCTWFHHALSRNDAEDMLKRIRSDGAFLVRESGTQSDSFAISFRAESKIKHCRIKKEGRMYCIGDAEFESLVKLVEYYEKKPLYRKMRLRYPVDWELIERQGEDPEEDIYNSDELYQEPNKFEQMQQAAAKSSNVTCKALYAYRATNPDELSFPKDAIITNIIKKDEGGWWQGDYGDATAGWLPCNYVEEIDHEQLAQEDKDDGENVLGALEKASMDVRGLRVVPRPSTDRQRLIFRITSEADPNTFLDVGAETEDEMKEWARCITEAAATREKMVREGDRLQKKMRIHRKLSDLVYYSQSVSFKNFDECINNTYQTMSSFAEKRALGIADRTRATGKEGPQAFNAYNCRQPSRIYPNGKRVDSSNYDPQMLWNCGCQLVALNYQTPDRPMWLNQGMFLQNGKCGIVLKPPEQRQKSFNPYDHLTYQSQPPLSLTLRILGARHLVKSSNKGIASPFVEVEICGVDNDQERYKTRTVSDNGFCPFWNETVTFQIGMPQLASIRFIVCDEDMFGDPNTIGQAAFPVGSSADPNIRSGYRSVNLKNPYGEPLEMSSLLVFIDAQWGAGGQEEEYQSLQDLRAQMRKTQAERDSLIKTKLMAQQKNAELPADMDKELHKINAEISNLEKQIMENPMEAKRLKAEDKLKTGRKKGGRT
eukprot:m.45184 g.45184  ORF g.45184 m.45184 type:complete len:1344 (+) comp11763_c0_seq1:246-4277(+)